MDSYINIESPFHHHQEQQQQQHNSGLLRFRSAPTSWLSNFKDQMDKGSYNGDYNLSPGFVSETGRGGGGDSFEGPKPLMRVLQNGYADSGELIIGQGQLPSDYVKHGGGGGGEGRGAAAVEGSVGTHEVRPMKGKVVGGGSNLVSRSSSPAGFFVAHVTAQNGYPLTGGSGKFSIGSGHNEGSSPPPPPPKGQIDFSSGSSSPATRLARIPELGNESIKEAPRLYNSGFSFSWDDSASLTDNGSEVRGDGHNDDRMLYSAGSDASHALNGGRPHLLSHHLSLPKSSAEMAAAYEKMLHFQDAVPCKIRAKRGCATHPRSIAERMRRIRISERMKKLQELVPNMEKQINTADMLDLAVDYIKDLQQEYMRLSAAQAKCRCSKGKNSAVNQGV